MTTLTEILAQYRAGERGLPTYAELVEIAAKIEAMHQREADRVVQCTIDADQDGHAAINA